MRKLKGVPQHDLLVAGFPCQPFSSLSLQPGLSDANGRLFEEIVRVLRDSRPPYFLLENVPGLLKSNSGGDMKAILDALSSLGYQVSYDLVNARHVSAQQRKRLYVVGMREGRFEFPCQPELGLLARDVLDFEAENEMYGISEAQMEQLRGARMSRSLAWPERKVNTLISHYGISVGRGGSQLVPRWAPSLPRLFTVRECARIMGFPNSYHLEVASRREAKEVYRLLGNAVCPAVVTVLAAAIFKRAGGAAAQALAYQALVEKDTWSRGMTTKASPLTAVRRTMVMIAEAEAGAVSSLKVRD